MGASGLGTLLVNEGLLTEQDRLTINKTCGQGSWAFAKSILTMGLLDEEELAAFVGERTRYRVAAKNFLHKLDLDISPKIDRRMCSRLEILPLHLSEKKLTVAVADPLDRATIAQLEFFTGLEIVPIIAPLSQIYEGLTRLDSEFVPRYSDLSKFLQNHAGGAWVKQKLGEEVEELDEDRSSKKSSRNAARSENSSPFEDEDEFSSSSADLDVLDENGPEDDFDSGDFTDASSGGELDLDQGGGAEIGDDFGDSLDAKQPTKDAGKALKHGNDEDIWDSALDDPDLDAAPRASQGASKAAQALDDLDLDSTLGIGELDELDAFDSLNSDADNSLPDLDAESEPIGSEFAESGAEIEASAPEPDFAADLANSSSDDLFGDLDTDTDTDIEAESAKAPEPTLSLEDESMSDAFEIAAEDDPLEAFAESLDDDEGPAVDPEPLPSDVLLASLDADLSETLDEPELEDFQAEPALDFAAESHDRLEPLEASLADGNSELIEDTDLDLDDPDFAEAPPAESLELLSREALLVQRTVTQTALVNEMLLRISLCFSQDALLTLLQEHVPLLSPAGCLTIYNGKNPLGMIWEDHKLLSPTFPSAENLGHIQRMMDKFGEENWQSLSEVPSIGFTAAEQSFSIFWKKVAAGQPGCFWLGQHDLNDRAFVEALESLVGQLVARIELGGLKVG